MNRHKLLVIAMAMLCGVSIAAMSTVVFAAVSDSYRAATQEGLASVQSRTLDEVYLRPSVDFVGYRKVLIEPVQVSFRRNWLKDLNATRGPSRWISESDAQDVLQAATASMAKTVADEFISKGYAIVTAPGPGVLRVAPSVTDLDVYEPDVTFSRPQALFTRDAGTATLRLEARDSVNGALLGVVVDRGTATQIRQINRTTQTSNQFWFDAMFRQWTANCIVAMQSGPAR
ncbi:MAG: DUF3313 family protein [Betaproteobacteria bacterium]